jgi:UDP-glucose 4-epimerase
MSPLAFELDVQCERVLITGVTGFIGERLAETLAGRGMEVVGLARTQPSADLKKHLTKFVQVDLTNMSDLHEALLGCSAVVHLAARVHVMNDKSSNPTAEYAKANVAVTLHLARQAVLHGIQKMIFLSSIKVNGERTYNEIFRGSDTPSPEDKYGRSKAEAEKQLLELVRSTSLQVLILRPPLIYGPKVKANFRSLIGLVKRGWPLPFGAVRNRRSLLFVDNLCDAIGTVLKTPNWKTHIYTISDGVAVSLTDLIRYLAQGLGRKTLLLPVPVWVLQILGLLTGRRQQIARLTVSLEVDVSDFAKRFNWQPPTPVDEALRQTGNAYKT